LLKKLKTYKNIFFKNRIFQLLAFKEGDYIIKLENKDPPYRLIYSFFKLELKELYRYINNIIIQGIIYFLILLIKILIIFIFKKDGIL